MTSSGPTAAASNAATALPGAAAGMSVGASTAAVAPTDFLTLLLAVTANTPPPVNSLTNVPVDTSAPAPAEVDPKKRMPATVIAPAVSPNVLTTPIAPPTPSAPATPIAPAAPAIDIQQASLPRQRGEEGPTTGLPPLTRETRLRNGNKATAPDNVTPVQPAAAPVHVATWTASESVPVGKSPSGGTPIVFDGRAAHPTPVEDDGRVTQEQPAAQSDRAVQFVPPDGSPPATDATAIHDQPALTAAAIPAAPAAAQAAKPPTDGADNDPSRATVQVNPTPRTAAVQPAIAVTAAPVVTHRTSSEADAGAASRSVPSSSAGTTLVTAAGKQSVTAPSANVQTLLDGVRGRLGEVWQNGQATLHLELSPPELGHVRMQLTAHDQQVDVRLVVQSDAARHVLLTQGDTLRERLGTLGVALGRFDVRQDGGGSAAQQEQPAHETTPAPAAGNKHNRTRPTARRTSAGVDVIA